MFTIKTQPENNNNIQRTRNTIFKMFFRIRMKNVQFHKDRTYGEKKPRKMGRDGRNESKQKKTRVKDTP